MGGNNPLIVHRIKDLSAAAYWTIQSAFITAGQRCSCARRLIVLDDKIFPPLLEMTRSICVGRYIDAPEPFMGPVISPDANQTADLRAAPVVGFRARPVARAAR